MEMKKIVAFIVVLIAAIAPEIYHLITNIIKTMLKAQPQDQAVVMLFLLVQSLVPLSSPSLPTICIFMHNTRVFMFRKKVEFGKREEVFLLLNFFLDSIV